jgi:hypothetical protein
VREVSLSGSQCKILTLGAFAEAYGGFDMKSAGRKAGQAKLDLSDESTAEVLKKAKSLIRTDWGGQDSHDVISQRMAEAGVMTGPKSVKAIRDIVEKQVEGCRKRVERRLNEAIRRCEASQDGSVEKLL